MSFFDDIGSFLGGAARSVPGWAEAAFLPLGVTAEALKQVFPGDPAALAALPKPPPVPDQTDDAIQKAALAQRRRLLIGGGMDATFAPGGGY